MGKFITYGLALLINIGISSSCLAVMLTDGTTDVGEVDTLLAFATKAKGSVTPTTLPNAGDATETAWVDLILSASGVNTTKLHSEYKIEPATVQATEDANVFAMALDTQGKADAHYFVIKNANYWALFENKTNMDWAVVQIKGNMLNGANIDLTAMKIPNDWEVSHINVFSVPEPSILAVLGFGLLSFGVAYRRRQRQ